MVGGAGRGHDGRDTLRAVRPLTAGGFRCLLGAVAAHAATGVLVHAGSMGGPDSVHGVHAPAGVLAGLAVLIVTIRQRARGRDAASVRDLVARAALTTGYLTVEAVAAEGYGTHLLHDPWILLAPAGVLLAHMVTTALATAVVMSQARPSMRVVQATPVLPQVHWWFINRLRVWSSSPRLGRAPPRSAALR